MPYASAPQLLYSRLGGSKADTMQYLGKYIRHQYDHLFPPRNSTGEGTSDGERETYKVWTASSARDIETAKAYVLGSFPRNQTGGDGTGDGEVVQLIEVPNHDKNWDDRQIQTRKGGAKYHISVSQSAYNKALVGKHASMRKEQNESLKRCASCCSQVG